MAKNQVKAPAKLEAALEDVTATLQGETTLEGRLHALELKVESQGKELRELGLQCDALSSIVENVRQRLNV